MNRREFLSASGAALLAPALVRSYGLVPEASRRDRSYAEEMPNMLVSYLAEKLNQLAASWDQKRNLLRTAADVNDRNHAVGADLLSMLGDFPPRQPLNAVTVKTVDRDGYRVEAVMFQSRPDLWVTGNLYVPVTGSGRFPAVISPCGHYPLARMVPQYQSAYISLAKCGVAVLAYDPIGQGERRQYWNPETDITEVGGPVFEHSMAGQLLQLLGENLTAYMVWEGMRAIDYLLTRPEVDADRVGCVGHSGGGTLTKFIAVADSRVQCAAILEGGTANQWPSPTIGLADSEQNLFPAALRGVDNVDLHAAFAPRPLLVCIESYSPEFNRAAEAIRSYYRKLGVEEKFETIPADDPHAWTPKLRQATTNWFCRWFYGHDGPQQEIAFQTSRPEDLYCTRNGSLLYSHTGKTIFSMIASKVADLPPQPRSLSTNADLIAHRGQVRGRLAALLRFERQEQPLGVRHIVRTPREGYRIDKIEFLSEPEIYVSVWVFVPERRDKPLRTVLYLNDEGVESDGMEYGGGESSELAHGLLDQLVRDGNLIIAADVRGVGATRASSGAYPLAAGEFGQLFDMDTRAAYAAWSMDRSLLGMRVNDVIRCVDYAMRREDVDSKRFHVIGKGRATLWCLFAAVFDDRIHNLICTGGLLSYKALAMSDRYLYGADVFIRDILHHFDLPEIAAAMAPRSLVLIDPKDHLKRAVDSGRAEETYHFTHEAYRIAGSEKSFRIETVGMAQDRAEHYLDLMRSMEVSDLQGSVKG